MSDAVSQPEERLWARHSNPKSGWSRLPTGPALVRRYDAGAGRPGREALAARHRRPA